ncbi:MAG: efflux RND transporter periplasmic adaptor subunit [Betaproteobacteria bacterium]|nr:efflux RND transporter periplasmic adaptor subunit [Betaproteobacteria bacterium]
MKAPARNVARALALALPLAALAGCGKPESAPEPVRPVQLAQVTLGAMAETAGFAGEVKPRHETDLAFRIGGKIVARNADVGARVKKGQVLARLDPADVALQAEAAKAAAAAAEAEYTYAKAEFERYQSLFAQKFVSGSALDQKRNAFNASRARLDQAKAQLAVAQNQSAYATLVAPEDGVITTVSAEAGQVVAAGLPVMKLAREDEREVAISVPENRIDELARAKAIGVALAASPQKIYPARVREISPSVDPVTRTFAVRVAVLVPDAALQWGMTATVGLVAAGPADAALLPLTSLYRQDDRPAVWIYDPATRKVELRLVKIGQYREDGIVVTSGLADGEWVVTAGVHKLRPGQTVRPYEGGPRAVGAAAPAGSAPAARR